MFSVLEQHIDGSWWYHPGYSFHTEEEAKQRAEEFSKNHDNRITKVFEHTEPMFQKYSTCTRDFEIFEFQGIVEWPANLAGSFVRR